jgi:hypothetical protein
MKIQSLTLKVLFTVTFFCIIKPVIMSEKFNIAKPITTNKVSSLRHDIPKNAPSAISMTQKLPDQ